MRAKIKFFPERKDAPPASVILRWGFGVRREAYPIFIWWFALAYGLLTCVSILLRDLICIKKALVRCDTLA